MPKFGNFIRTSHCCRGRRGPRGRRRRHGRRVAGQADRHDPQRRRQHVRRRRSSLSGSRPSARRYGYELQYSPIGSGGGVAADHRPHGRLRRERRAAHARSVHRLQGLRADPMGARRRPRSSTTSAASRTCCTWTGRRSRRSSCGQITTWNDPAIKKLNKGVNLPSTKIAIVHRSDNSGTTYNFTDYLSSVSPPWKSQVGTRRRRQLAGRLGRSAAAPASQPSVSQTPGGIGYVDVAYALKNHLKFFAMKNRSGKFATPGLKGILAAATSDQKPDATTNELSIVNPPKKYTLAYPISTYTYVIAPTSSTEGPELRKFLFWAVTKGQTFGPKLLFQPIPKSVLVVAEKAITQDQELRSGCPPPSSRLKQPAAPSRGGGFAFGDLVAPGRRGYRGRGGDRPRRADHLEGDRRRAARRSRSTASASSPGSRGTPSSGTSSTAPAASSSAPRSRRCSRSRSRRRSRSAIALYLTELAPRFLRAPVTALVETLAAIPSVVIGLWGILVLGPVAARPRRARAAQRARLHPALRRRRRRPARASSPRSSCSRS